MILRWQATERFLVSRVLSSTRRERELKPLLAATYDPPHDKTNKMACAPSEDSD